MNEVIISVPRAQQRRHGSAQQAEQTLLDSVDQANTEHTVEPWPEGTIR